jgi:hypothetical protein
MIFGESLDCFLNYSLTLQNSLPRVKPEFYNQGCFFGGRLKLPLADCVGGGLDQYRIPSNWLSRPNVSIRPNHHFQLNHPDYMHALCEIGIHRSHSFDYLSFHMALRLRGDSPGELTC